MTDSNGNAKSNQSESAEALSQASGRADGDGMASYTGNGPYMAGNPQMSSAPSRFNVPETTRLNASAPVEPVSAFAGGYNSQGEVIRAHGQQGQAAPGAFAAGGALPWPGQQGASPWPGEAVSLSFNQMPPQSSAHNGPAGAMAGLTSTFASLQSNMRQAPLPAMAQGGAMAAGQGMGPGTAPSQGQSQGPGQGPADKDYMAAMSFNAGNAGATQGNVRHDHIVNTKGGHGSAGAAADGAAGSGLLAENGGPARQVPVGAGPLVSTRAYAAAAEVGPAAHAAGQAAGSVPAGGASGGTSDGVSKVNSGAVSAEDQWPLGGQNNAFLSRKVRLLPVSPVPASLPEPVRDVCNHVIEQRNRLVRLEHFLEATFRSRVSSRTIIDTPVIDDMGDIDTSTLSFGELSERYALNAGDEGRYNDMMARMKGMGIDPALAQSMFCDASWIKNRSGASSVSGAAASTAASAAASGMTGAAGAGSAGAGSAGAAGAGAAEGLSGLKSSGKGDCISALISEVSQSMRSGINKGRKSSKDGGRELDKVQGGTEQSELDAFLQEEPLYSGTDRQGRYLDRPMRGLDLLLRVIEKQSGIDVDSVEVDPFEIYLMRRNEAREVAGEVHLRKEAYYRNFMSQMRRTGKINPDYSFAALRRDDLNNAAFTEALYFLGRVNTFLSRQLLLLFGDRGSGKTQLCHAIANKYMSLKAMAHYHASNPELPLVMIVSFDDVKQTRMFTHKETAEEKQSRDRSFNAMCKVDLLILDGLCSDNVALEVFSQKIFAELLMERSRNNLPMVITTSVNLQAVHRAIGDLCYESIKSFDVNATALLGRSRRAQIMFNGAYLP
ncbi:MULTISPECIES: hypothetical protein [unclassified Anaerobiospirillum]|uniref:hypothetical protein n=1 Tax=unclassified Anaerobiospirillum TaxID=2647410 RepID=UPI001FF68E5A|nr:MULTISPECIES: hypothetical protein [unclassified Anaerobiospirillum]MCK0535769.1 hypothetical protein [Anaerobiospirillum sp. NML120511]MCK0540916.1 hypothetical protein [Anaerobiospirillum sp. NML02-A-032]